MTTFLTKNKLLTATAAVGFSVLGASSAQAASFNFSYIFDDVNNVGVPVPTFVNGMFDGDLNADGETFSNVTNVMATVTAEGPAGLVTLGEFTNADFLSSIFTVSGVGVNVATDETIQPFVSLIDSADAGDAKVGASGFAATEDFTTDRWSVTAKSVPEGDMSMVSWLALATIGGLSVKKGKSLLK